MKRKENFIMRNLGGENLLVPLGARVVDMNGILILNETGSCLWEYLEKDCTLEELATALSERFDVSPKRAILDVQNFLDQIMNMGMLER